MLRAPGPDLVTGETEPQVVGQPLPHRGELAIRVAVDLAQSDGDGIQDVVGHLFGNRVSVLVHVQSDRQRGLRGTIRRLTAEVVTDGQIVEACAHLSHRRGGW